MGTHALAAKPCPRGSRCTFSTPTAVNGVCLAMLVKPRRVAGRKRGAQEVAQEAQLKQNCRGWNEC